MRDDNSTKWIIITLILIVVILVGIIAFAFWLRPAYDGFILGKQREAYNVGAVDGQKAILTGIKSNVAQFGYVQITFEDNQILYLAPLDPNQVNEQPALEVNLPSA